MFCPDTLWCWPIRLKSLWKCYKYVHVFVKGGQARDCQVRPSGRQLVEPASRIGFTRGATSGNQEASIAQTPGKESFQPLTLLRTGLKAPALLLPSPQLPSVIWTCWEMCGNGWRIGGWKEWKRRRRRKEGALCAIRATVTGIAVPPGHRTRLIPVLIILASDVQLTLCQDI